MSEAVIVDLMIPGEPQAAPRPKAARAGGVYYPGDYKENRDATAMLFKSKRKRKAAGQVRLDVWFVRSDRRRKDADNLLKLILDAGNGILWEDDSQVVAGSWLITFGIPARTHVRATSFN